jgi:DNA-binding response OmpR family regulator
LPVSALIGKLHNIWMAGIPEEMPAFSFILRPIPLQKIVCMTILLVDDDEDDRKLFIEAAKEFDSTITCLTASDGMEALWWLQDEARNVPDYIFLDLRMPGLSGEECLIEIKKASRMATVPVIVYTTSRDVQESVRLKQLGATHFMTKPFAPEDVYYMVAFVLGERW